MADLISSRVIVERCRGRRRACKSQISKPVSFLCLALGLALLMPVAWGAAAIVGSASLARGVLGARLAQKVSDRALRVGIVAYGVATAIWLFLR